MEIAISNVNVLRNLSFVFRLLDFYLSAIACVDSSVRLTPLPETRHHGTRWHLARMMDEVGFEDANQWRDLTEWGIVEETTVPAEQMTEAAKKAEPDAAEQVEEVSDRLLRSECTIDLGLVLISLP